MGLGKRLADKIEADKYWSISPSGSVSVVIVLEEIPDLCNISHNGRSFSAGNITVLKEQEWLSHAQSSNPDLPETWANHFSVELFS